MRGSRKKFSLQAARPQGASLPPDLNQKIQQALNPEQFQAAIDLAGHQLILAGAGTGKTRTLIYRVAALIGSGISPQHILLLTFTRKAAQEMLRRVASIMGQGRLLVQGGTFHSWAVQVLRTHGQPIGLGPHFTIADASDAEDIVGLLRNQAGLGNQKRRFLQKSSLYRIFSRHANTRKAIAGIISEEYPRVLEDLETIERLFQQFQQYKKEHQIVDYDDLMTYTLEVMQKHPDVLSQLQREHRYILVDEYQDTNLPQGDIVRLLAGDQGNLTVVGDESQAIYSFRGSDPRNILEFEQDFSTTKRHTLTRNYRSVQPILDISNQLMQHAAEGYAKTLQSEINQPNPDHPILAHCGAFENQAEFIALRILQLHEEGIPLQRIAVLFRSASQSAELEIALQRHQIPFRKFGGIRFIEAAHIKDLCALLRIVENPKDLLSWQRILLLIPGIGSSTAQTICSELEQQADAAEVLRSRRREKRKFFHALNKLANWFQTIPPEPSPDQLLESGLEVLRPWLEEHYFDDFQRRLNDLNTLIDIGRGYTNLEEFLSELSLDPPEKTGEANTSEDNDDSLVLSTIHSAKGLEWQVVFVLNLLEGHLPSYFALSNPNQIEEERRLLYVALTRAQRQLLCCVPETAFSAKNHMQEIGLPSRFLEEIPEDLFEHWDIED